ncbi:MAG: hypothetical protein JNL79_39115 [Myxococcales bacterium]|nr:hypothetical protein [Myxococcales bacterium]
MVTLVVTSSWPRADDPIAGTFVRADARARAARGERIIVAAPRGASEATSAPGITVVDVPCAELFGTPGAALRARAHPLRIYGLLPWYRAIRRLVLEHTPDRVVAHWIVPGGLVAARAFDGPVEIVAHGADVRLLEALPFGGRLVPRRANVTLRAVSEGLAARLRALGTLDPIVEPMPLDDDAIERARQRPFTFTAGRPIRVVAGRLIAAKRIERAIDRTAALGGTLVLVGDGPSRAALVAEAGQRRIPLVTTGAVRHEDALRMLAGADEVIAPLSVGEGAPTVVREARALGVKVAVLRS